MAWVDEMGYSAWDGDDFEVDEEIKNAVIKERDCLDLLNNYEFINYILKNGKREIMNAVVGVEFPGYDVAERIWKNARRYGLDLTKKQRKAIRNVYLYSQHDYRNGLY